MTERLKFEIERLQSKIPALENYLTKGEYPEAHLHVQDMEWDMRYVEEAFKDLVKEIEHENKTRR